MSKEKPEIGDVWIQHNKIRYHIIKVDNLFVHYVCYYGIGLSTDVYPIDAFLENTKYLGKSKVNIKALFEVESAE